MHSAFLVGKKAIGIKTSRVGGEPAEKFSFPTEYRAFCVLFHLHSKILIANSLLGL